MTVACTIALALTNLQAQGLDRLDAQLLLLHALGRAAHDRAWLLSHDADLISVTDLARLAELARRRSRGEPLAYLTGYKEFYGLNLQVDHRVLVPRPDTETLVDWALEVINAMNTSKALIQPTAQTEPDEIPSAAMSALDLGTGSGAIALALKASMPTLQLRATDFSLDALAVARKNAHHLQLDVQFQQGSWLDSMKGRFNVIVSNPPYIAEQDEHLAALAFEPIQALTSGSDGLDDLRQIITQAPAHLHAGGWLLVEHGYDQAEMVRELLRTGQFDEVQSRCDLSGIERCSGGRRGK
jgi:release factor glutamine methyltransferase